jgi:hypothetical protein
VEHWWSDTEGDKNGCSHPESNLSLCHFIQNCLTWTGRGSHSILWGESLEPSHGHKLTAVVSFSLVSFTTDVREHTKLIFHVMPCRMVDNSSYRRFVATCCLNYEVSLTIVMFGTLLHIFFPLICVLFRTFCYIFVVTLIKVGQMIRGPSVREHAVQNTSDWRRTSGSCYTHTHTLSLVTPSFQCFGLGLNSRCTLSEKGLQS